MRHDRLADAVVTVDDGERDDHRLAEGVRVRRDVERKAAQFILEASSARFDGSDLMPAEVGAGSFWKGITDYVSGSADLDAALTTIQDGWSNVKK